jgi:hypothetical protein
MPRRRPQMLGEQFPELETLWDPKKNAPVKFYEVVARGTANYAWICQCGLTFRRSPMQMGWGKTRCDSCESSRRSEWSNEVERMKSTTVAEVPELLAAWADEADASEVFVGDPFPLRKFRCAAGHEPRIAPWTYLHRGCPHCRSAGSTKRYLPEDSPEMVSQWHPTRNKVQPDKVPLKSTRMIWWVADCCGFEWEQTPGGRNGSGIRCPRCLTVLGSLAWHEPDLAAEWSPLNEKTAWQVKPYSGGEWEWVCSADPTHIWVTTLANRMGGAECRDCTTVGKSRAELAYFEEAQSWFPGIRSGPSVRESAFTQRRSWIVDMVLDDGARRLAIEYDGAYWHADKASVDVRKTTDLLAAGYLVVRLREHGLLPLSVKSPSYLEIDVSPTIATPSPAMKRIAEWAGEHWKPTER